MTHNYVTPTKSLRSAYVTAYVVMYEMMYDDIITYIFTWNCPILNMSLCIIGDKNQEK